MSLLVAYFLVQSCISAHKPGFGLTCWPEVKLRPCVSSFYCSFNVLVSLNELHGVFYERVPSSSSICSNNIPTRSLSRSFKLNLQNTQAAIWLMEIVGLVSINHHLVRRCTTIHPFLKGLKSAATHGKQLIWLGPSYITIFVMLRQKVCGAARGWRVGLE